MRTRISIYSDAQCTQDSTPWFDGCMCPCYVYAIRTHLHARRTHLHACMHACVPNLLTKTVWLHWRQKPLKSQNSNHAVHQKEKHHYMNSFQTTLTPNPEQLYKYYPVTKQWETAVWMCSSNAFKFRCRWLGSRSLQQEAGKDRLRCSIAPLKHQ